MSCGNEETELIRAQVQDHKNLATEFSFVFVKAIGFYESIV